VYGRSEKLRTKAAKAGLAYVAIIPCDYLVTMPSGTAIRADEAVTDAVSGRRSQSRKFPRRVRRRALACCRAERAPDCRKADVSCCPPVVYHEPDC
jgi:hypothetical protein